MSKKNKVINLFDRVHIENDESKKYSVCVGAIMEIFESKFPEDYLLEDIFEFIVNAWNMANIKEMIPAKEFKKIQASSLMPQQEKTLLTQIIQYKIENYGGFDRFIADFELYDIDNEVRLTVITQRKEEYLMDSMSHYDRENFPFNEADEAEAYINRSAMALTPKEPFLEWLKSLDIDFDEAFIQKANTYLLDEAIEDLDKWLFKKFDVFFKMELAEWHAIKKEWPMKRTYKMFEEWFEVALSTSVYDMVKRPIFKV
jgi:hypothetical protein